MSALWIAIGSISSFVALAAAAYLRGGKDAKDKADTRDAKAYVGTRKRMDEAPIDDDIGLLRDGLRKRNPDQR